MDEDWGTHLIGVRPLYEAGIIQHERSIKYFSKDREER
jgi:hypothetical protein